MKRVLGLFLVIILLLLMVVTMTGCSCSSGYKNYDDFQRNASPREKEGFYDWWSRNP